MQAHLLPPDMRRLQLPAALLLLLLLLLDLLLPLLLQPEPMILLQASYL